MNRKRKDPELEKDGAVEVSKNLLGTPNPQSIPASGLACEGLGNHLFCAYNKTLNKLKIIFPSVCQRIGQPGESGSLTVGQVL